MSGSLSSVERHLAVKVKTAHSEPKTPESDAFVGKIREMANYKKSLKNNKQSPFRFKSN